MEPAGWAECDRFDALRHAEFMASHDKLHLLINNAAIMATPFETVQWSGVTLEKQFVTNHLGPFLLTGLLQKVLESTPGSRVINHSSSVCDFCQVGCMPVPKKGDAAMVLC